MATDALAAESSPFPSDRDGLNGVQRLASKLVEMLASLKLTVALFFLAICIIFIGTLAQVDKDMWEVIDIYFRSYFAWVEFKVFFPRSWFPALTDKILGGFWMPGGFLIGAVMAINLLAAHLVRFKVRAKGAELGLGLAVIAAGTLVTYWVIASGHNSSGLQGEPGFSWETFWLLVKGGLVATALVSGMFLAVSTSLIRWQRFALLGLATLSGGLAVWASSQMPSPSSLRILWQLFQGGLAGLILLAGCMIVFKRRAGIVLLHTGIGLMMFSEFFVSEYAVEGRMTLREGETVNYLRDVRKVELAVIDRSSEDKDVVVAVPGSRLEAGETVQDETLPFDIYIDQYIENAEIVDLEEGAENYANRGSGLRIGVKPRRASAGTDGGEVDMAAAYVDFRKKGTQESLGKYLLSQILAANDRAEEVEVDGANYDVFLRFKRDYKSYSLSLKDVRKDDYMGTNTPMNYSSDVVLMEGDKNVGDFRIWMNNPLRYAGETFYQSGYNVDRDGNEITDLQVVTNTGWMMPYVGCMLVTVGMLMHFSLSLGRFLAKITTTAATSKTGVVLPAIVVVACGLYVLSKVRAPSDDHAGMKIHEFGKLPVVYQGRVKPLDTLARNSLRIVSNKDTFEDAQGNKRPAIQWFLDVVSDARDNQDQRVADQHQVYRIDNLDVLATLGLQRRKGFRYAESEFELEKFEQQLREARSVEPENMSFYQRKLIEVEERIVAVRRLQAAFTQIPYPAIPTQQEFAENREEAMAQMEQFREQMMRAKSLQNMLDSMQPPLVVPIDGDEDWLAYSTAWNTAVLGGITGEPTPESTLQWNKILASYASGDAKGFNEAVEEYQGSLDQSPPENLAQAKVPFEFFFNYFQPFKYSLVLYIVAFVLVAMAWLATLSGYFGVLNRTSFWLIVLTFALHTFALAARVHISGRPPITNLYSSAVFIGWAAVGLGIILEWIYGLGIGNALSAICGGATLMISYALAADGDTFTVLQAVLDTQFWLATHVVCITLGYATTFVAGVLGVIYLLVAASRFPKVGKPLASMIYGSLCFAIYFSFVGTVLGGLWADDSWGRFWGWDPKENGALIIVLWNALILHARWGGMVRQHGLAVLAVIGNITTAWSWFGVNELGVGLHSYGFTEGVLRNLGIFVISMLGVVVLGQILPMVLGPKKTEAAA